MERVCSQEVGNTSFAWKLVDKPIEQRCYPRIGLDLPVVFRNGSGQYCSANLVNFGPNGIQIRCNVATAPNLHPGGGKIRPGNSPIVHTAITMPLASGAATLSVCAQLSYLTTFPGEPRCVLGLQFLDPRPKAQRIIEQFFTEKSSELADADDARGFAYANAN